MKTTEEIHMELTKALCALVDHEAQITEVLTDSGLSEKALHDVCAAIRAIVD